MKQNQSIVILGCGLSGIITALSFASKGLKTLLLERSNMKFPPDQRNTGFTIRSKNFFKEIGLWDALEPHVGPMNDIYILDNKAPESLHFCDSGPLGYMIENSQLRLELEKAMDKSPLIEMQLEVDYEYLGGGKLRLGKKELAPSLIIVCDGRKSEIKHKYFPNVIEKSYEQSALTFFIHHSKSHEGTSVEHFMTQGPFAILPLRDHHRSSIVWTEPTRAAELYLAMDQKELELHLRERIGEFLGDIQVVSAVQAFPLSAKITKNYFYDNMVVLGDSAHTIHPLSAQGLNQGIKDIEALTDIISRNLALGLEIDRIALEEYSSRRKADNYKMYLFTDNLNRIFSNNLVGLSWLRKAGLDLLDNLPGLKSRLLRASGFTSNR